MHGPGLDVKHIVPLHRYFLQVLLHRTFSKALFQISLRHIMAETVHQAGILRRIQNVPHLTLSPGLMLLLPGVRIIRVHLHRQISLGINEFDENRQPVCAIRVRTQIGRMRS